MNGRRSKTPSVLSSALGVPALLWLLVAVLSPGSIEAATLCVNPGGTGGCFADVQSAVDAANNGDEITIAAGTYSTSSCVANHVNFTQSPIFITINKNLTIQGAGAGSTILSGGCRVIWVTAGTVTISGVTVTGGTERLGAGGGGVRNDSNLTMIDSVITGNSSTGSGGGFQSTAGSSIFQNVLFASNTAGAYGAGLRTSGGAATLTDVTIQNNVASAHGGILDTSGSLTLNRVTLNGNTGAAVALGPGGSTTLTNVTITGNNAGSGDALIVNGGSRHVVLNNATIDANSGIGIYQFNSSDTITVRNSIVSNNGGDCLGSIVSGDYNLIENPAGCTITGAATHDIYGQNSDLAALADNGGPTNTMALCTGPGSPSAFCAAVSLALNSGSPETPGSGGGACEAVDQRGVTRPQDDNGNGVVRCDMGAYEAPGGLPGPADQTITVIDAAPPSATFDSTFDVSATASSGLAVAITTTGGCSGSGSGSATITMTSGTTACVVQYNQAGDPDYNAAPEVTSSTSADPASQTITVTQAAPPSAIFNSTFDVAATASSGLTVAITTSGGCSGSGSGGATITMTSGTTACVVHYNQLGSDDYSAALEETNSASASPASQTITVTQSAPTVAVYNQSFNVAATSSSGLAVSITTTGSCSGSGTGTATITMTSGNGNCNVRYNQAGNANYLAAPLVSQKTTAQKLSQTITVTQHAPATATTQSTFTVAATASSGLPVSVTTSGSVCSNIGNTITIGKKKGTCKVTFSQSGNTSYAAAAQIVETTTVQ